MTANEFMENESQKNPNESLGEYLKNPNESLEEYRRGVETLMELKSSKMISNSEPAHAAILFDVFFRSAKKKVRIFCKNLSKDVFGYDFLLKAAKAAVERGVKIQILIQDSTPNQSLFSDWVKTEPRVQLISTKSEGIKNSGVNFTVMDDHAFRFEENKNHCHAMANMNSPETANFLSAKFDQLASLPIAA